MKSFEEPEYLEDICVLNDRIYYSSYFREGSKVFEKYVESDNYYASIFLHVEFDEDNRISYEFVE